MAALPLTRAQAWELVKRYNSEPSDLNHYLESEAVMIALAQRLDEDPQYWGMLGLLHDIDWGLTKSNPVQHLTKAPELLSTAGFDPQFIEIILSHGYGFDCAGFKERRRSVKVEFALAAAETVTGLIYAYALMRKGLAGMEVTGLKKKMKDKRFAAAVNREIIMECTHLGVSLEEFLALAIKALQEIGNQIGFPEASSVLKPV